MNLKDRPRQPLSDFAALVAAHVAAAWFPLTPAEILGPGRSRWIADARSAFSFVLQTYHVPTKTISGFTGRSISAVDHSIRAARAMAATDAAYRDRCQAVFEKINATK